MDIYLGNIPARPRSKRLIRNINEVRKSGGTVSFGGDSTQFSFSPPEINLPITGEGANTILYTVNGFTVTKNVSEDTESIKILWDEEGEDETQYITLTWQRSGSFYDFTVESTPNVLPAQRTINIEFIENVTLRTTLLTVIQAGTNLYTLTTSVSGNGSITSISPTPSIDGKYLLGTNVTLTANNGNTSDDYFVNWLINGSTFTSRSVTIIIGSDVTAIANFDTYEAPPDEYSLYAGSSSFSILAGDAGTKSTTITSLKNGSSYGWQASESASWITLNTLSGSNGSTLSFTCSENTTNATRSAYIYLSQSGGVDAAIYVSQLGRAQYVLSANPNSFTLLQNDVSTKSATITSTLSSASTPWTASSNQTWCTLGTSSGGNGGTLTFSCSEHIGSSNRSATITVRQTGGSTYTISVTQTAYPAYEFEVSPSSILMPSSAGSNGDMTVSVSRTYGTNAAWTASSNQTWCSLGSGDSSGTGAKADINAVVTANTGGQRSATITFRQTSTGVTRTVTIIQQAASVQNITVSASYSGNSSRNGSGTISVYVNGTSMASASFPLSSSYSNSWTLTGIVASTPKTVVIEMTVPVSSNSIGVTPSGGGSLSSGYYPHSASYYGSVAYSNSTSASLSASFSA